MNKSENFKGIITKQVVSSKKLNYGNVIRTLTISDLHGYTNDFVRASRLALAIKGEEPDIVFIAGDLYNGGIPWDGGVKLEQFRSFIQNISEVAPICITWGNHDLRGLNSQNIDIRLKNLRCLENVRPGKVFPLYNDRVIVNDMEIVGYVPRFNLMEEPHGLQTQLHGIAHDEYIRDYHEEGVKFENKSGIVNVCLVHDPHLIAASENGIGLEDLSVCDFFVTGHLHDGYRHLLRPIDKIKKVLTNKGLNSLELDKGFTERMSGHVDRTGVYIKGSKKLWLGSTNLCRGIVYIDDAAQQKFLQMADGNYYKNESERFNVQVWQPVLEETAKQEIIDNNLHFMLISEGIAPSFFPKEKLATMNVVDIENKLVRTYKHK